MWKSILVLCLFIQLIHSHKLLVIFPFASKSHLILGDAIVDILLEEHEVTYITPFPRKNIPKNLRQIDVSENANLINDSHLNITAMLHNEIKLDDLGFLLGIITSTAESTLSNNNVQKLMNDKNEHFDLIFIEWMFTEVYSGLSTVFKSPYVWFSTVEPHWMVLKLIDDVPNPAYNQEIRSKNVNPMNFVQRAEELFSVAFVSVFQYLHESNEDQRYQKFFSPVLQSRGDKLPPLSEVKYNASLMFGNSHYSLGQAARLPQNYIPIGGYHIKSNFKPLPADLKKIMDNSKSGVIYFSMGSNLKSKHLPDKIKKSLLKMFGSLKQTVLWKFEENLSDLPENVHILNWAPQPAILAHPNCILFITHGGLLSTIETVHYGVPVIGVPIFGDQFVNTETAVKKGYAKRVDLSYNIAAELKNAIEEIISDPSFTQRVKELSLIYHDRPVSPANSLKHWINHVIKTKGALHLRSPALMLSWYQKMYLDLLVAVLVVIFFVKILLGMIFRSKSVKVKKN